MGLETGTYIDSLVAANPVGGDALSQADDHIRLLKSTIKATLPNLSGAVTPTHTELNYVDGVTSSIQDQLDAHTASDLTKLPLAGGTMTGDITLAGDPDAALKPATKQYVDAADALALPKAGGTLTGDLVLAGAPDADLKAATKKYVDDQAADKILYYAGTPTSTLNLDTWYYFTHSLTLANITVLGLDFYAKCLVANNGYAIGDIIALKNGYYFYFNSSSNDTMLNAFVDSTRIGISVNTGQGSAANYLHIAIKPVYPATNVDSLVIYSGSNWGMYPVLMYKNN